MDDEVEAFELEGVDRGRAPRTEARPRVVERDRTRRQPEARQVERDTAQLVRCQHRQQLAIEERRRRDAVHASTGSPAPVSRTKLRTPAALNSRPAARCAAITAPLSRHDGVPGSTGAVGC
jgi:hypothetical protein